ncbi:hypothetical protein BEP19_14845 [Ammoniphilus oxalaticus]|uniref:Uncharacterized protein n=1 Tax=Ammoniphilus oxalaticus TaxID=66863 RepID=A0A419SD11_9BACL|nr:hypothetical protein [Ammoniphilus oxalaticus]RKD20961.1 hypothetical protein BEP19_14845 [Ammoniphilus oxalaticus]
MSFFRRNTNDIVMMGGNKVEVRRLTVKQWRQIFGALNQLPGIIFSALTTENKNDLGVVIVAAVDICFDEVVDIISIASGLTKEDIEDSAALDEIVEYIEKLIEKNNFEATLKKLQTAGRRLFTKTTSEKAKEEMKA